ncbi:MAG: TIGR03769 domain-containing protein [Verrucomicrobiota bacterium]
MKAVDGPRQFGLWQNPSPGGYDIQMDSADGIDATDVHTQIIGSHEHFNWGFTTNGVYNVTFQLSGQRAGETTNIISLDTTFTFNVLPLPTNALPTTIQLGSPQLLSDASFSFSLRGGVNHACVIQATVDFVGWTTITNLIPVTSPQTVTLPADAGTPHRFVRVQAK